MSKNPTTPSDAMFPIFTRRNLRRHSIDVGQIHPCHFLLCYAYTTKWRPNMATLASLLILLIAPLHSISCGLRCSPGNRNRKKSANLRPMFKNQGNDAIRGCITVSGRRSGLGPADHRRGLVQNVAPRLRLCRGSWCRDQASGSCSNGPVWSGDYRDADPDRSSAVVSADGARGDARTP
jgi:hypothetical protein